MASSSKDGDDFWNTSSSISFDFDADDEVGDSWQEQSFNSFSQESHALPIDRIISKFGVDCILASTAAPDSSNIPSLDETVRKLVLGLTFSLSPYKSLSEKIQLLDAALDINDGNVVLQVLDFIKSTLEQSIFHQILTRRKAAVFQYASRVMFNDDTFALPNFYMATGYFRFTPEMHMICSVHPQQYVMEFTKSPSNLSKNSFNPVRQKLLILKWQSQKNVKDTNVINLLVEYTKYLIEKNELSNERLYEFKRFFDMDNMSFEWVVMNVFASKEMWPQISELFMKPNWFNKKNVLKLTLCPDKFVYGISKHGPPKEILDYFLTALPDGQKAANLAAKLKCHKFVIHYYLNQKDKAALINYKTYVTPHTEEYLMLENAIQSIGKKWKH